jgi:oxygen-independent coproporphyrinogen-3 oxidase
LGARSMAASLAGQTSHALQPVPARSTPADDAAEHADALGIYISVPFCRAKCTFCNFASGVYPVSSMPAYVDALCRQVQSAAAWAVSHGLHLPRRVDTVYLGGGTPSLLPPALVQQLFGALRSSFNLDPNAEITLEAAPLQLDPPTLDAAMRAGVNRVSFGVQSFVEGEARATARMHSGQQALAEFARVRAAGIRHISADLIAGLPGQTHASWATSLAMLADAPLDHASVYMFELDEDSRLGAEALRGGTRFGAGLLPHEDVVADWYALSCDHLHAAGLVQYEISNFAREGGRSRHNERYWLRRPYLGFGVDAHSMLTTASQSGPEKAARFSVGDSLPGYLEGAGWSEIETLGWQQELEECWFLGLRRTAGVSLRQLVNRFGTEVLDPYQQRLNALIDAGLLQSTSQSGSAVSPDLGPDVSPAAKVAAGFWDRTIALTLRGRLLSNDVFSALLLDETVDQAVE